MKVNIKWSTVKLKTQKCTTDYWRGLSHLIGEMTHSVDERWLSTIDKRTNHITTQPITNAFLLNEWPINSTMLCSPHCHMGPPVIDDQVCYGSWNRISLKHSISASPASIFLTEIQSHFTSAKPNISSVIQSSQPQRIELWTSSKLVLLRPFLRWLYRSKAAAMSSTASQTLM